MAADAAIFVGWDRPVAGHDAEGLRVFGNFMEFLGAQQAAGQIESFEPVALQLTGNNLTGFAIVRGTREKLDLLKRNDRFQDLMTEASFHMLSMSVIDAHVGEGLQKQFARFQKFIK